MYLHVYIIVPEFQMNKTFLTYVLLIGIAATAGIGTGAILKRTVGPIDEIYPKDFSPDDYKENIDALYLKYQEKLSQGANILNSFTNSELVNIGLENYRRCFNCYSVTIGDCDTSAGVKQTIRNSQVKNGEEYFEEALSYSKLVSVGNRIRQTGKEGNVLLYTGSVSGPESVTYTDIYKEYEHDEYRKYLGKTLDEMFIYIISEKTVLSSKKNVQSDEIVIELSLNPNISTYYYKYQMMNISGLSNLPPFETVNQVYTFSKDLVLKHIYIDEVFTATKAGIPVPARSNNKLDTYYYADAYLKIPDINEKFDYSIVKE